MLSTYFIATYANMLSSDTSRPPHGDPSQAYRMLLYRVEISEEIFTPVASVQILSPVTFSARTRLTSELLRFL